MAFSKAKKRHIKQTKKRQIKRRTNKRYVKKGQNKRRTNKRYTKKRQRGGKFNPEQEQQLKDKLKTIGFTDDAEIDNIVTNIIGKPAQVFASPSDFNQLLYQMDAFTSPENFREWIQDYNDIFDEDVETDNETTSDT